MNDMLDSPGTRIKDRLNVIVGENETIRCRRDYMVVEPLDWIPSKLIIVAYQGEPLRGIVRAIGPGTHPKCYNGRKGQRTKSWDSKAFRPCDVKVGDTVEFGGLELKGFLHPTIVWGSKEMVLCREEDIAGIVEQAA
jgi:co-chaperonin GroES (HSP10)